ncbi:MAG: metallophosphoesterase [Oscillospiraceae bacterium]|nr:metallophosphoesterase [Oscillospiraceae bacterium]
MKITVFSDTHRNYGRLKDAIDRNLDSDLFIHLGDGLLEITDISNEYAKKYPNLEFAYVRGNSDFADYKDDCVVEIAGHKIFCTHGHNYDVHWSLKRISEKARSFGCKIALFGHTHIYRTEQIDSLYIMNPGSLDRPRGGNRPTYGIITISDEGKIDMNIVAYKEAK